MARVRVIVEGQTEESFVRGSLAQALLTSGVYLEATLLGSPGRRGGNLTYQRVREDVIRTLKQDPSVFCSTFFDFYGLGRGFPEFPVGSKRTSIAQVEFLERNMGGRCASRGS